MKVKENSIFNLMDTNGRRNDVFEAFQGYISILSEVTKEKNEPWSAIPNSLSQFNFYKKALEMFPEVFKMHTSYDWVMNKLDEFTDLKKAFENEDLEFLQDNYRVYEDIFKKCSQGIEDRARHYTSNLVKLGFTDAKRNISRCGEMLLNNNLVKKDKIEKLLLIDTINVVYLRQLLKLKVFDQNGVNYYSPLYMAIYLLLHKERVDEKEFFEIVQGTNPYIEFEDIDDYIDNYTQGKIIEDFKIEIPETVKGQNEIDESMFKELYKNQKSSTMQETYYEFYKLLYQFSNERTIGNLNSLVAYYELNRSVINKAFGCGKNMFGMRRGDSIELENFIETNYEILEGNINTNIYIQYTKSKLIDAIREYSDTTKRIFKATGIFSFDNGYVELAYKELCSCIFEEEYIKSKIINSINEDGNEKYHNYEEYEEGVDSYFCSENSLCEILELNKQDVEVIIIKIQNEFGEDNIDSISEIIANRRKEEFKEYIERKYPLERIKEILGMFCDRNNDEQLKEIVGPEASVPTIYEYIVGIAWYYFSGKRIDLLDSYNLTMSANFEPLIHAGGGQGDIVIYTDDRVVMLEATLMDTNAQKRGEWEPVLRHSINLKAEEEVNNTNRDVISFFIADEFDDNTINIWKAIASVPLQSTTHRDRYTDNVIVMPINNYELNSLIDKSEEYNDIINSIIELFSRDIGKFNMNWRDEIISEIM